MKSMNRLTNADQTTVLEEIANKSDAHPFRILISTILSQRTKDENTRKASNRLFSHYPDVESLAKGDPKHVEKLIRVSGFYHVKARSVVAVAKKISRNYGGDVPNEIDKLLELPLVGRKTANCVLAYGFRIPAIPVDTHVHRIANRLSIVETKSAEETELELREGIERKFWLELNEEFVIFGQRICRSVRPRCLICELKKCCSWYRSHRRVGDVLWSKEKKYDGKIRPRCSD